MDNKIQCQICKNFFEMISPTHLKKHNISMQEYKKMYPEKIIKLNHYTNFQPLCSKINRYIKRNY